MFTFYGSRYFVWQMVLRQAGSYQERFDIRFQINYYVMCKTDCNTLERKKYVICYAVSYTEFNFKIKTLQFSH